jgi:formylglycine-generating enzyme required for sulfatase activity
MRKILVTVAVLALAACAREKPVPGPAAVAVPEGVFVMGSDDDEREAAYRMDEAAYGHGVTREQGWYNREIFRREVETGAYNITLRPITNAEYARFVAATGHRAPDVDKETWKSYGLIHPWKLTRRHAWADGKPPPDRGDHPVVLVSHADAEAYAAWLSEDTGHRWRLPSEAEWEKAARGANGRRFPWGDAFDAERLNSYDKGPYDTTRTGELLAGVSPFGMLDAAGQVYEWTSSPAGPGSFIVKGGSWDDKGCGVCRPAARHSRPADLRHIVIGIRLIRLNQ